MKREIFTPRLNWQERCKSRGFSFFEHSPGKAYWNDSVVYSFTTEEIDNIEAATNELHSMCIDLVGHVVKSGDYQDFGLSQVAIQTVETSWNRQDMSLYGRFDLGYDGSNIKMLEYNADTPTSLVEGSVIQWDMLEDRKLPDQFNSIHDRLIERWKQIRGKFPVEFDLYFTALETDCLEDEITVHYLMETALQSGVFNTPKYIDIESINFENGQLVDIDGKSIKGLFKLYAWEWLTQDLGEKALQTNTIFIEPAWKMLLSNKAVLAKLWERNKNHPNLLEAWFDPIKKIDYVKKPLSGRDGENVEINQYGKTTGKINAATADQRYVYQDYMKLPTFDGFTPVIGSWVVGDESAGIGIREDEKIITTEGSYSFVPHYFK